MQYISRLKWEFFLLSIFSSHHSFSAGGGDSGVAGGGGGVVFREKRHLKCYCWRSEWNAVSYCTTDDDWVNEPCMGLLTIFWSSSISSPLLSHHSNLFLVIFMSWYFYCPMISHCFCARSPIRSPLHHRPLPHLVSSGGFIVSSIWSPS